MMRKFAWLPTRMSEGSFIQWVWLEFYEIREGKKLAIMGPDDLT